MFRLIGFTIVILLLTVALVAQPATRSDASASPMAVRTLKGCTLLYRSIETDMQSCGRKVEAEMKLLLADMKSAGIVPAGAPIFVFHDPTAEAGKTFTIDLGFPVSPDTKESGKARVRRLESIKAATVMFSGPPTELRGAYEKLYEQIGQSGLTPGTELRQYSLYWEGLDSPNNVMLLQVELK